MGKHQIATEDKICWHCKREIKKGQNEYITLKHGARCFNGIFCVTANDVGYAVRNKKYDWMDKLIEERIKTPNLYPLPDNFFDDG